MRNNKKKKVRERNNLRMTLLYCSILCLYVPLSADKVSAFENLESALKTGIKV